jgi:hypothetical protein
MKKILLLFFLLLQWFVFAQKKWDIQFYTETVNREYMPITMSYLHFMVFMNEINGKRISVKTLFNTTQNAATYLEQGKNYTKK